MSERCAYCGGELPSGALRCPECASATVNAPCPTCARLCGLLEEIRQWASGEREVGEGEDAEAALILIDNIARQALSGGEAPADG